MKKSDEEWWKLKIQIIDPEKYRKLFEWMLSDGKTIEDIAKKVRVKPEEVERVMKLLRIK